MRVLLHFFSIYCGLRPKFTAFLSVSIGKLFPFTSICCLLKKYLLLGIALG